MKISKSQIIKALGPFGLFACMRWLMRKSPRIVMFHRFSALPKQHHISSDELEKQIVYLKKRFNMLPLSRLRSMLKQCEKIPENSIALTVDDGYQDFYNVAYPILKKHRIPATLYVTTGFINKELWLWPDQISWLLDNVSEVNTVIQLGRDKPDLENKKKGSNVIKIDVVDDSNRHKIWSQVVAYLLSLGDQSKHEWIACFAEQLGKRLPVHAPNDYAACTWAQLEEMQANGIEIGGHTHTHPSLGQVSDKQLLNEISLCKMLLDKKLGNRDRDFCFPNGQPSDYNAKVKEQVKKIGFKSSVTAFYDARGLQDLFEMRRHTASQDWFQFCKSSNGVEAFMAKHTGADNKLSDKLC